MPSMPAPRPSTGKATPLKRTATGKLVSAKSKTGATECSAAMSAWKTSGMTPAIAAILGKCRSMAYQRGRASGARTAGNEARAQHWEANAQRGLTMGQRAQMAKQLRAQRADHAAGSRLAAAAAAVPVGASVGAVGGGRPGADLIRQQWQAMKVAKGQAAARRAPAALAPKRPAEGPAKPGEKFGITAREHGMISEARLRNRELAREERATFRALPAPGKAASDQKPAPKAPIVRTKIGTPEQRAEQAADLKAARTLHGRELNPAPLAVWQRGHAAVAKVGLQVNRYPTYAGGGQVAPKKGFVRRMAGGGWAGYTAREGLNLLRDRFKLDRQRASGPPPARAEKPAPAPAPAPTPAKDPRTRAVGVISGGAVGVLEKAGYRIEDANGRTHTKAQQYDMAGHAGVAIARRLEAAGLHAVKVRGGYRGNPQRMAKAAELKEARKLAAGSRAASAAPGGFALAGGSGGGPRQAGLFSGPASPAATERPSLTAPRPRAAAKPVEAPSTGKTIREQVDERTREARQAARPSRDRTLPKRSIGRAEDMISRLQDAASIESGANPQFSRYAGPIAKLQAYIGRGGKSAPAPAPSPRPQRPDFATRQARAQARIAERQQKVSGSLSYHLNGDYLGASGQAEVNRLYREQGRLERLRKRTLSPEQKRAEFKARQRTASPAQRALWRVGRPERQLEMETRLPSLQGTPRQVQWANAVRSHVIRSHTEAAIRRVMDARDEGQIASPVEEAKRVRDQLRSVRRLRRVTSAGTFIDLAKGKRVSRSALAR